jgi:HlyD family secretion protein
MNELDQTFRVDARFEGSSATPFVHSSVEANIITGKKNNALLIPRAALLSDDSVKVSNGEPKMVFVKTGIRTLEDVEILSGIDENTVLVIPEQK